MAEHRSSPERFLAALEHAMADMQRHNARIMLAHSEKVVRMGEMTDADWREFNTFGALTEDGQDIVYHPPVRGGTPRGQRKSQG